MIWNHESLALNLVCQMVPGERLGLTWHREWPRPSWNDMSCDDMPIVLLSLNIFVPSANLLAWCWFLFPREGQWCTLHGTSCACLPQLTLLHFPPSSCPPSTLVPNWESQMPSPSRALSLLPLSLRWEAPPADLSLVQSYPAFWFHFRLVFLYHDRHPPGDQSCFIVLSHLPPF